MAVIDADFWLSRFGHGMPCRAEFLPHEIFDAYREATTLPLIALDADADWAMQVLQRHRKTHSDPDHEPYVDLADLRIVDSLDIPRQFRIAGKLLYEAQRHSDPMMVAQLAHAMPTVLHRLRFKVLETDDPKAYLTFREFLLVGVTSRRHRVHLPGWKSDLYDQIEDCRNYLQNNDIVISTGRGR